MKPVSLLTLMIFLSVWLFMPVPTPASEPEEAATSAPEAPAKPEQADIFDFQGSGPAEQNNEDDLALDDRIRVKVEPVVRNPVVERVVESARIKVKTPPGFFRVDIFIEPVDAPFGGKSLAHPKMLGQAFGNGNFSLKWASPERYEYVKIFALAYKNPAATIFSTAHGRSRAVDVALGGNRLLLMPDLGP
jgi:hypothetical protein